MDLYLQPKENQKVYIKSAGETLKLFGAPTGALFKIFCVGFGVFSCFRQTRSFAYSLSSPVDEKVDL